MAPAPYDANAAQPRAPESRALTGVRGVAALWVVLFHLPNPLAGTALAPLLSRGYLGVDLFFILSGFVLALVYRNVLPERPGARHATRFYWIRLARIYPLHVVVLTAFVVLELAKLGAGEAAFGPDRSLGALLKQLALVHAWGFGDALAWNRVAWSISAEWAAYLVFPFTFSFTRGLSIRGAALGLAGCVVALCALELSAGDLDAATRLALLRCMPELHAGMLLAQLAHHRGTQAFTPAQLDAASWAIVSLLLVGLCASPLDTPIVVLFAVLVLILFDERARLTQLLGRALVHRVGVISYSVYMLQYLVSIVVVRGMRSIEGAPAWLGPVAIIVVLIPLAELSFRYIESAARYKLRRVALREPIA